MSQSFNDYIVKEVVKDRELLIKTFPEHVKIVEDVPGGVHR
jgi:hypothetical protein